MLAHPYPNQPLGNKDPVAARAHQAFTIAILGNFPSQSRRVLKKNPVEQAQPVESPMPEQSHRLPAHFWTFCGQASLLQKKCCTFSPPSSFFHKYELPPVDGTEHIGMLLTAHVFAGQDSNVHAYSRILRS